MKGNIIRGCIGINKLMCTVEYKHGVPSFAIAYWQLRKYWEKSYFVFVKEYWICNSGISPSLISER